MNVISYDISGILIMRVYGLDVRCMAATQSDVGAIMRNASGNGERRERFANAFAAPMRLPRQGAEASADTAEDCCGSSFIQQVNAGE